jgi:succinoglycan biosynthesis transport protein ExoP
MPENTIGMNGTQGRSRWQRPAGRPGRLAARGASRPWDDRGTRLAELTERQARGSPGAPGAWQRFLLAHARWILLVTAVATCCGAVAALSQTPMYTSQANVVVEPSSPATSALQATYMATEKSIASSGAVLAPASRAVHIPEQDLLSGLSVSVPPNTYLLQISYSSPDPATAQQRAQAIANAYVAYRSGSSGSGNTASPGSVPGAGTTPSAGSGPGSSTSPSATVVTPASLPASPSSPDYLLDIGVALLIGACIGIGTAGLRDHLDDRVRGSLDLEAQAGAPVLALIPAPEPADDGARGPGDPATSLAMVSSPESVTAEAYRGLRTRLVQAAAAQGAGMLLITSPGWEDRGAVAANLAAALAQSGRSTILVCADLRWGGAHHFFGPGSDGGGDGAESAEGLAGLLDWRARLPSALLTTSIPGLRLLPPGPPPPDPAAALQRPALRAVLGEIRNLADFAVIESPPLLASADTGPLAELTDMVLLVADTRQTSRAQVRAAARELEQAGGSLTGCVLVIGEGSGRPRIVPRHALLGENPAHALRRGRDGHGPAALPPAAVAGGGTAGQAAEQSGAVRVMPGPIRPADRAGQATAGRAAWVTEEESGAGWAAGEESGTGWAAEEGSGNASAAEEDRTR